MIILSVDLLERVRAAETVSRFADIAKASVNGPRREQLLRGAGVEWVAIQTKDEGLHLVLEGKRTSRAPFPDNRHLQHT